jgi:hypothetical protein
VSFDAGVVDPEVTQVQGDQAGPSAESHRLTGIELARLPCSVLVLELDGEPEEVSSRHRRESTAHREHAWAVSTGHAVANASLDGPTKGGVGTVRPPESESPGRLIERQGEAVGLSVQAVG